MKVAGRLVIGFGAGEPYFPTPDYIVEAAAAACKDPRLRKYTPASGLPELNSAVAAKTLRDSGFQVDASQILITNGGKHARQEAFGAFYADPSVKAPLGKEIRGRQPQSSPACEVEVAVVPGGGIRHAWVLPPYPTRSATPTWPKAWSASPRCSAR